MFPASVAYVESSRQARELSGHSCGTMAQSVGFDARGASGASMLGKKRGLADLRARDGDGALKVGRGVQPRLPDVAPVCISVYCYGDSAADHVDGWPAAAPLFQVQMTHEANPSYTMAFRDAFNEFLKQSAGSGDMPQDLQELQRTSNVKVQVTRAAEPNNAGIVLKDYRIAIYVAGGRGNLTATLEMLHSFVRFRSEGRIQKDRRPFPSLAEQQIIVGTGPRLGSLALKQFCNPDVIVRQEGDVLPHNMFDAASPNGNQFLVLDVEFSGPTTVMLGWTGRTWNLRGAFEECGIPLAQHPDGGFYRFINDQKENVATQDDRAVLLDIVTKKLRRFPCVVRIISKFTEDGSDCVLSPEGEAFVAELSQLDHVLVV